MATTNGKSLIIPVLRVVQHNNQFFLGRLKASDLLKISTVHVRGSSPSKDNKYIDEVIRRLQSTLTVTSSQEGIQRLTQIERLKKIADYIKRDGILPTSLLVAVNNKAFSETEDEEQIEAGFELVSLIPEHGIFELRLQPDLVDAFIVDGQHRLASFAFAKEVIDEFELAVTIFLEMQIPLQAELFSKINGTQKPVNKSLLYDLSELQPGEYNDIKRCHAIAKWFNINSLPFKGKIKMLGTDLGSLSQSAFIDALLPYLKERKVNNHKSFLRTYSDADVIRILTTYFETIYGLFSKTGDGSENYILSKTTGFGAFMKLLYYVFAYVAVNNLEFNKVTIQPLLQKLHDNIDFSTNKTAGQGLQLNLSRRMREELFGGEVGVKSLDEKFKLFFSNNDVSGKIKGMKNGH